MFVAAIVPIAAQGRVEPGRGHRVDDTEARDGSPIEVPVQLGLPGQPGFIPAVARVLSRHVLEVRCTRLALRALQPSARFITPEALPHVHARVYLPHRGGEDPVPLACDVAGVTVSDSDEFLLRAMTVDLSAEDVAGLAEFCNSAREI